VNRAGGRSGSLRNIGRIEQWNVGSGAGGTALNPIRPAAVALFPAPSFTGNYSCRAEDRVPGD